MSFLDDSYFSITDILVSEERIQSEIQQPLPNLGFLHAATKSDEHLLPGMKLDLPLWLAEPLCRNRNTILSCEIPKIFRDSYKEILQAEACAVELSKWSQYYYELGLLLYRLKNDEGLRIAEFLREVFKSRFRVIMDYEQDPYSSYTVKAQLSALEKKLLAQGNSGRLQLLNWLNRGVKEIKTSNVISNIRKRKRLEV